MGKYPVATHNACQFIPFICGISTLLCSPIILQLCYKPTTRAEQRETELKMFLGEPIIIIMCSFASATTLHRQGVYTVPW